MATLLSVGIAGSSYKSWYAENINISFNIVSTKNITCKVLYTENGADKFSPSKVASKTIKSGSNDVKIVIPASKLARFRLYFGDQPGLLNFSKLRINGDKVIKLDDFVSYEFNNMDSSEVVGDGSITLVSEQQNPYMYVNQVFNVKKGYDINFVKVGAFVLILFGLFFGFFMFALREKKKKKKDLLDYY